MDENEKIMERLLEEYEIRRQKSQRFLELYPRLVKAGFILIFTVPVLFMLLMFTVNQKLVFLVLWIISILVIAGYLIGIEYFYFYYKRLHEEFEALRRDGAAEAAESEEMEYVEDLQEAEMEFTYRDEGKTDEEDF